MSTLFIDEVIRSGQPANKSSRFQGNIDSPKAGEVLDEYTFLINGWTLIDNSRPQSLDVFLDGKLVRTLTPSSRRIDVATRFGSAEDTEYSGFRSLVSALSANAHWTMRIEAVTESGERFVVGIIKGRRTAVPAAPPEYLQPLLLTSLGRSGSTYLMRLLFSHPSIAVLDRYPYESRTAQYRLHMARVSCEPVNEAQSASRTGFWSSPWWTGNNPYYAQWEIALPEVKHWLGHTYVHSMLEFCARNTEDFYRVVANGQQHTGAKYFAEKSIEVQQSLLWEQYPGMREIFLVRDFRDRICSVLAFNAKRGTVRFGRQNVASDKEYIMRVRSQIVSLHEQWKQRSDRAHLVRYEDLIKEPIPTLQRTFEYLNLDAKETLVHEVIAQGNTDTIELQNHRTTSAPQNSIGRWKTDLSPELQDACLESFGDLLPHFGYA